MQMVYLGAVVADGVFGGGRGRMGKGLKQLFILRHFSCGSRASRQQGNERGQNCKVSLVCIFTLGDQVLHLLLNLQRVGCLLVCDGPMSH